MNLTGRPSTPRVGFTAPIHVMGARNSPLSWPCTPACSGLAWKKKKTAKSGYTAGGVSTRRVFRHGFYEARFKVPPTKGWHPKFWMMHHGRAAAPAHPGSRQEIDVCENDSITPTRDGANLSGWRPAHQGHGYRTVNTPAESADFHGGRRVHAGENHRPLRRPYREYR